MRKNRFFTLRIYNLEGEVRKRIQLVITREKVPLMREVEEGRTLVRLNLHIHSGNSGLSSLNDKDPMETV